MAEMTPEQLDEARAKKAHDDTRPGCTTIFDPKKWWTDKAMIEAARLAREGWTPTDPDLIEAREIVAAVCYLNRESYLNGEQDETPFVQRSLAAIKRGRELERPHG